MKSQTNASVEDIESDIKAKREKKLNEFIALKYNELKLIYWAHEKKILAIILLLLYTSNVLLFQIVDTLPARESLYAGTIVMLFTLNIMINFFLSLRFIYITYICAKYICVHGVMADCIDTLPDEQPLDLRGFTIKKD